MNITIADLKSYITPKMKGTLLSEITDPYGLFAGAARRMISRIDTEETRRTVTLSSPFYDNVQDYAMVEDYKRMIDIRPQAGRQDQLGKSHFEQTTARQFDERLDSNSFSIRWNNMVRSIRAQRLPAGNVSTMDTFESTSSNGLWTTFTDASNLIVEPLNFVQGSNSLSFDLDGSTGVGGIVNSTAPATDMSALKYHDSSFLYVYIPLGFSSRFTNFKLRRGSSSGDYKEATATTKGDGTAFNDGWNFLRFDWISSSTFGNPDDTKNTYRYFGSTYTAGTAISGFLIDSWTDSLGSLYEIEYYSEYMFRSSTGAWKSAPTDDSDLINVGPVSYEIFVNEVMRDIVQVIRVGSVLATQTAMYEKILDGEPANRYTPNPKDLGLYTNYGRMFPSSAITTVSKNYDWDL